MPVIAITDDYRFPSRSRQELYGDDQLVHVMWKGNPFFAAPATFRTPKATSWAEFVSDVVEPWASTDPDFTPGSPYGWRLDGEPFEPTTGATLDDLGVGHKSLLSFES
jgi:phenol hydroxylase P4 protein